MPSTTEITVSQLSRLIGLPHTPIIIDVRAEDDFAADPRLIPGARRRDPDAVTRWAARLRRPIGHRCLPETVCNSAKASAPGCGIKALRPKRSKAALLPGARMGHLLVPAEQSAGTRCPGPHGLGDAGTAEDRAHRLPVADPPFHRSRAPSSSS